MCVHLLVDGNEAVNDSRLHVHRLRRQDCVATTDRLPAADPISRATGAVSLSTSSSARFSRRDTGSDAQSRREGTGSLLEELEKRDVGKERAKEGSSR